MSQGHDASLADGPRPQVEKLLFTEPDWRSKRRLQFDIPSYYHVNARTVRVQPGELLHSKHGFRNYSRLDNTLGDRRLYYDTSFYQECYNTAPPAKHVEEKDYGLSEARQDEMRRREYQYALSRVPKKEIEAMEDIMRTKLAQRHKGGAFQLRSTFKYLDRDGSGGIDFDETRNAFELLGLSFTETQILAYFASHDVDQQGAISYKAFLEKMGEKDFLETTPSWLLRSHRQQQLKQKHHHHHQQAEGQEEEEEVVVAHSPRPSTAPEAAAERLRKADEEEAEQSMTMEEADMLKVFNFLCDKATAGSHHQHHNNSRSGRRTTGSSSSSSEGTRRLDFYGLQALLLVLGLPLHLHNKREALAMLAEEILLSGTSGGRDVNNNHQQQQATADFPTFWRWWVDQQQQQPPPAPSSPTAAAQLLAVRRYRALSPRGNTRRR